MGYDWKDWIRAAGIRALKTVAQTAAATIATAARVSCTVDHWRGLFSC